MFVNTVLSRQGNPETMTVMNTSGVDALVANLVAASNPRAQSAANMRCRINDDEPFVVLSSAEHWEQLKRTQYFFPVRFQGVDTSMMELVIQCLRKLECSTVIYEVLRDTPFLESPAQILHDIFVGRFKNVGFMKGASTNCHADVAAFLKPTQSENSAVHLKVAQERVLVMLGFLFGNDAYQPWL